MYKVFRHDIWNTLSSTHRKEVWETEVAFLFTAALPDDMWMFFR